MPIAKRGRGTKTADRETGCEAPAGTCEAAEQRCRMIAEAAYLRALERNFAPGGEIDDWLQAEREIDAKFPHLSGNFISRP